MAYKYYAVRYGDETGIYTRLEEAEDQIRWSGEMEGFDDLEDAEDYIWEAESPKMYYVVDDMIFDDLKVAEMYCKQFSEDYTEHCGIREARSAVLRNYNSYDERLREDLYFINSSGNRTYQVYTDGACLFNGHPDAAAGCGVYYGRHNGKNHAFNYDDAPQTNQTAELKAIEDAVTWIEKHRAYGEHHQICTDSDYAIKCLTVWYKKWQNNGWLNSKGLPVANENTIKNIVHILYHKDLSQHVSFVKVEAHSTDFANSEADRLAGIAAEAKFERSS